MASDDFYVLALDNYSKKQSARNPWLNAQVAAPPINPNGGFLDNFLSQAITGVASGLMQGYGKSQIQDEEARFQSDLGNILKQPESARYSALASDPRFAELAVQEVRQKEALKREVSQAQLMAQAQAQGKAMGEAAGTPTSFFDGPNGPIALTEKNRELFVPGVGFALTDTDSKNLKKGESAVKTMLTSLETIRGLRKEFGVESYDSAPNAMAKSAVSDFNLALKELASAGALDAGLIKELEKQISQFGLGTGNSLPLVTDHVDRLTNLISDPMLAKLDQTEKQIMQGYQERLRVGTGQLFAGSPEARAQEVQAEVRKRAGLAPRAAEPQKNETRRDPSGKVGAGDYDQRARLLDASGVDYGAVGSDEGGPRDYSLKNEAAAAKNRFLSSASDLAGLGAFGLSHVAQGVSRLTGGAGFAVPELNEFSETPKAALRQLGLLGEESAQTLPGRLAGEVASFAPGALLGGGLPAIVGGGLAAGATKEVTDNPWAALAAGLVGGSAKDLLTSGKNLVRDFGGHALPARHAATRFQTAANNPNLADDIERLLVQNADDPFAAVKTTAELTRNAGLAQLQRGTAATGGEEILAMVAKQQESRDAIRKMAIAQAGADDMAGLSRYEAGNLLREEIYQPFNDRLRKATSAAFDDVYAATPDARLPLGPVQKKLAETEKQFFPSMRVSSADGGTALEPISGLSGDLAELATKISAGAGSQNLKVMQGLRSKAGAIARKAAATGDGETATIAGKLKSAFDDVEQQAAAGTLGNLTPDQSMQLTQARALHAARIDKFGKGSSKRILAKNPEGDFKLPAERVIDEVLRTSSGAKKFSESAGSRPEARALVRGQVRAELENMTPAAQKRYILGHKEQFKSVLAPAQHKALQQVARDIADEQSVGLSAGRAFSGGSSTAANLTTYMGNLLKSNAPGIKQVAAIAGALGLNPEQIVNKAIIRAALDPKAAVRLLRAPTKKVASDILTSWGRESASTLIKSLGRTGALKGNETLSDDVRRSFESVEKKSLENPQPERPAIPANKKAPRQDLVFDPNAVSVGADPYQTVALQLRDRVIKQESAGNPKAVSRVGAKGLMQLMDATGREMHAKMRIGEPYDPFDPEQNQQIGLAYLAEQLKRFDGNQSLALAAYNAGPNRVSRAVKKAGSTQWSKVMPLLPAETQDYVVKILKKRKGTYA